MGKKKVTFKTYFVVRIGGGAAPAVMKVFEQDRHKEAEEFFCAHFKAAGRFAESHPDNSDLNWMPYIYTAIFSLDWQHKLIMEALGGQPHPPAAPELDKKKQCLS